MELQNGLNPVHWRNEGYTQRMSTAQWRKHLLSEDDKIVFRGHLRRLVAINLGAGVVEIGKAPKDKSLIDDGPSFPSPGDTFGGHKVLAVVEANVGLYSQGELGYRYVEVNVENVPAERLKRGDPVTAIILERETEGE